MIEYYIFCFIFFLTIKQNKNLNTVVSEIYLCKNILLNKDKLAY